MFSLRSEQVKIAIYDGWGQAVYRVKRLLLAIVALCFYLPIFAEAPAVAQEIVVSSFSTTVLIEICRRAGDEMRMDCAGYIAGVYDQMSLSRLICPPPNPNGGTGQAVAVALKFLNEHPEQWHLPPVYLVGQSFKAAFPCGAGRD
jgi:Rap1a immunity proteins